VRRIIRVGDGCVVALAEAHEAEGERSGPPPAGAAGGRECAGLAPAARADCLAARLAARRALRHACRGGGGEAVTIGRRPGRPPVVRTATPACGSRRLPVALSLAHRDGLGAAAVAPEGARVGVDVERRGGVRRSQLRYFATPEERAAGPRDGSALWALKEAAWKALGLAQDRPFHTLVLEFDGSRRLAGVRVDGARHAADALLARPWPRHLLAVVRVDA